jgi:hypothetical protein
MIEVKTKDKLSSVELSFEVLNAIHSPNSHPTVSWQGKVE